MLSASAFYLVKGEKCVFTRTAREDFEVGYIMATVEDRGL